MHAGLAGLLSLLGLLGLLSLLSLLNALTLLLLYATAILTDVRFPESNIEPPSAPSKTLLVNQAEN